MSRNNDHMNADSLRHISPRIKEMYELDKEEYKTYDTHPMPVSLTSPLKVSLGDKLREAFAKKK